MFQREHLSLVCGATIVPFKRAAAGICLRSSYPSIFRRVPTDRQKDKLEGIFVLVLGGTCSARGTALGFPRADCRHLDTATIFRHDRFVTRPSTKSKRCRV